MVWWWIDCGRWCLIAVDILSVFEFCVEVWLLVGFFCCGFGELRMVPRWRSKMGSGGGIRLFEILVSGAPVVLLLGWILVDCFFAADSNGGRW